jgi:hypothetical protein
MRDDDDDDRDDDRRSRRGSGSAKQGSNSTLFIILGVVGGVLLLCCGGGIFGVVYVTNKTAEAAKDFAKKFEEEMKKQQELKGKFAVEEKVIGKLILDQNDRINPNDPQIDVRGPGNVNNQRKAKTHNVQFSQGKTYVINMRQSPGSGLDPVLILNDAKGNFVASDDDGGGYPHARIMHIAGMNGQYRIFATSFGGGSGDYKLTVEER